MHVSELLPEAAVSGRELAAAGITPADAAPVVPEPITAIANAKAVPNRVARSAAPNASPPRFSPRFHIKDPHFIAAELAARYFPKRFALAAPVLTLVIQPVSPAAEEPQAEVLTRCTNLPRWSRARALDCKCFCSGALDCKCFCSSLDCKCFCSSFTPPLALDGFCFSNFTNALQRKNKSRCSAACSGSGSGGNNSSRGSNVSSRGSSRTSRSGSSSDAAAFTTRAVYRSFM